MEKHTVSRLIGAPPGYVGYDEGGQLTEAVRRRPYSVVLFDEIEKAHPDVFNVLLQLLDDGRLTDGQGRVVDFKNAIVIMTSNLGSELILEAKDMAQVRAGIDGLLRATFKPEFINRIDETVVFERLGKDRILAIVDIQLALLARRMADRKIELEVSKEAKAFLADAGFDPLFGARPLKRAIQSLLQNALASEILAGRIKDGQKVQVGVRGGALVFRLRAEHSGFPNDGPRRYRMPICPSSPRRLGKDVLASLLVDYAQAWDVGYAAGRPPPLIAGPGSRPATTCGRGSELLASGEGGLPPFIRLAAGIWPSAANLASPEASLAALEASIAEAARARHRCRRDRRGRARLSPHGGRAPRRRPGSSKAQLALASTLGLPMIVHSRDAAAETLAIIGRVAKLLADYHPLLRLRSRGGARLPRPGLLDLLRRQYQLQGFGGT